MVFTLQDDIDDIGEDVSALNSSLSSLDSKTLDNVGSIQGEVSALNSSLSSLDSKTLDNVGSIQSIRDDVSTLNSSISSLDGSIRTEMRMLNTSLSSLDSRSVKSPLETGLQMKHGNPGPMLEKVYNNNPGDRYGIGQYPMGKMRIYAADAFGPATVNTSFAKSDGTFLDVMQVSRTGVDIAPQDSRLCVGSSRGLCVSGNTIKTGGGTQSGRLHVMPEEKLFLLPKGGTHLNTFNGADPKISMSSARSGKHAELCIDGSCMIGDFGSGLNRLHVKTPGDVYMLPSKGTYFTADWGATPTINMVSGSNKAAQLCIDGVCIRKADLEKIKGIK